MCGIIGFANIALGKDTRRAGLDQIVHRGPDGEGEWSDCQDGTVWLGHRRLSIIDISENGAQPMQSADGRFVLTYNGEIYNSVALRRELEFAGAVFRSTSDTEVLLHALTFWGVECLNRLEGMFAFALWDNKSSTLTLCRDRVGMKPLYYTTISNGIAFASEATALATLLQPVQPPEISATALSYLLSFGYIPSPHAIYARMQKLKPGHYLQWHNDGKLVVREYWQPPEAMDDCRQGEHSDESFTDLFSQVVSEHTLADVPIGLLLSGGNDSIAIAAALRDQSREKTISAFTLGFDGDRDETEVASSAAQHLGFSHHASQLSYGNYTALTQEVMAQHDEPMLFSALLSMHQICGAAKQVGKAVLAGDGGDEVFGGYNWYRNMRKPLVGTLLPKSLRGHIARWTADPIRTRLLNILQGGRSDLHYHAWRVFPRFVPEEIEQLLKPAGVKFSDEQALAPLKAYDIPSLPLRRRMQRIDLMTFGADLCCAKIDRAGMRHGIEVRTPFLDRRIIEWGLTLPVEAEESKVGKPCVKRYLNCRVPREILTKPKTGFSVPIANYIDREDITRQVLDGPLIKDGIVDRDVVVHMARAKGGAFAKIWMLYMLGAWWGTKQRSLSIDSA